MIRLANRGDLPQIERIFAHAKQVMIASGNATQWVDGYPSKEVILHDISQEQCYVYEEGQRVEAVFSLIYGEDPTYRKIYQGEWLNDKPYATIHRIASLGNVKGVSSICMEFAVEKYGNIRVDTHEDNKIMQRVLEKNGFHKCGIIYVANGTSRLAYQYERSRNSIEKEMK